MSRLPCDLHWVSAALGLAAAGVLLQIGDANASPAAIQLQTFGSARRAFAEVLKQEPLVLGIGEYHQKKGGPTAASSLARFSRQLLPLLKRRASDLVIETWITQGDCGETEKVVVKDVEQTIQRPAATENQLVRLIKRAARMRIKPHILEMNCKDYRDLLGDQRVNYERFLTLTARQLRRRIDEVRKMRQPQVAMAQLAGRRPKDMVVVYGGALHNDLFPKKEFAAFSYAEWVSKAVGGRYVELDLFVAEYIERDDELLREQPWFALFEKHRSRRRVLLFRRAKNAYVLIFRRGRRVAPARATRR